MPGKTVWSARRFRASRAASTVYLKSKRKVFFAIHALIDLFDFGRRRNLMDGVSVHIDGLVRLRRASVLAASAANTNFRIHLRDDKLLVCGIRKGNHVNRFCRTMLGTCAAACVVGVHNAISLDELGHAKLSALLLLHCQRKKSTGGTDVRAFRAFISAVPHTKIHTRLQHAQQTELKR